MFGAPPVIATEIFTRQPDHLRIQGQETAWSRRRGGGPLHSFLEGPSFDRAGNLYCVDINHGRIFRISPAGDWEVFAHYDGNPNGLKIHKDGRIFVADHHHGLLCFDPVSGKRELILDHCDRDGLMGLNDLVFADNGDLYFSDPGPSGLENPIGRVYRLRANGGIDLVAEGLPYPNGLVLTPGQDSLYVAVTRSLQVLKFGTTPNYRGLFRYGLFLQLSGGLAGPDGMAIDADGNLAVAHSGLATVWLFSAMGEPMARIKSCAGIRTTNVAFGGPDGRDLYITESQDGVILRARMPVAGRPMYSHR